MNSINAIIVSPSSSCSISGINFVGNMTTVPHSQLEMLEATHRGLHKFNPRHHDEIEVEIGDPIYVQKEADDLWCEGKSLSPFCPKFKINCICNSYYCSVADESLIYECILRGVDSTFLSSLALMW